MSFLSRSAGSAPLSPEAMKERKEQVMNEVRQQLSLANAQELVNVSNPTIPLTICGLQSFPRFCVSASCCSRGKRVVWA